MYNVTKVMRKLESKPRVHFMINPSNNFAPTDNDGGRAYPDVDTCCWTHRSGNLHGMMGKKTGRAEHIRREPDIDL